MIGPYYRPQLTSMLSILHRITGLVLAAGALAFAAWLLAIASGPAAFATYLAYARSLPGMILSLAVVFALSYHWLNGLRHLVWDSGWGFELPRAYATGWTVVAGSVLVTAGAAWALFAQRGGA
jgi:succinate dehydrogenase / fumarate reductase cytochrome b subunit